MYADWRLDAEAGDEAVTTGTNAMTIEDPEACVWRDEKDSRVIRFSLNVDATDFDDAGEQMKRCLRQLRLLGLPGRIVGMEGTTDTHMAKWESEDLDER